MTRKGRFRDRVRSPNRSWGAPDRPGRPGRAPRGPGGGFARAGAYGWHPPEHGPGNCWTHCTPPPPRTPPPPVPHSTPPKGLFPRQYPLRGLAGCFARPSRMLWSWKREKGKRKREEGGAKRGPTIYQGRKERAPEKTTVPWDRKPRGAQRLMVFRNCGRGEIISDNSELRFLVFRRFSKNNIN